MHKKPASKQRSTGSFYTWIARYSGTFMFLLAVSGSFVYAAISWPIQPGESGYPVEGLFWNLISKGFVNTTLSSDGTVFRSTALKQPGGTTGATVDSAGIVTFTQVARGISPVAGNDLVTKTYLDGGLKKLCEDLGNTWNDTTKTCVGGGPSNSCNSTQPSCQALGRCSLTTGTPTSVNQAWVQDVLTCGYSCTPGWTGADCNTASPQSCSGDPAPASTSVTASSGGVVWGTGPFTTDSNLGKIARYLGAAQGSTVSLTISDVGCQPSFAAGNANGVVTSNYGPYRGMTVTLGATGPSNSCSTSTPSCQSLGRCSLTTGTPTSVNQSWVQNASNCGYSCVGGWSGAGCTTAPVTVSATINTSSTTCTVPVGASQCSPLPRITGTISNLQSGAKVYIAEFKGGQGVSNFRAATTYTTNGSIGIALVRPEPGLVHYVKFIDSIDIASANTISNVITINASCASGSTWNGSICAATASPTVSGNMNNCTIAVGGNSCYSDYSITTSNFQSGTMISLVGGGTSNFVANQTITRSGAGGHPVTNGTTTVSVRDQGGTTYKTFSVTATCASGSTWNGSSCANTKTAIITSSPGKCDISIGKSSCNGFAINVAFWGFVLGIDNITIAKGRPTVYSLSQKINSMSQPIFFNGFPIGYGSNTIYLADSAGANNAGISYDSFTINGVCEPGSTWNGTICASNYVAQASSDCAGDRNGDNEEDLGWFDSNNVFSGVKQYCSGTRGLRCGSKGSALHYVAETRTIESTTPQCCTIDRVSINGWCVKYSDVGQYCYTNNQCKAGIACVNNVCAYKTEDQWCSSDESCAPGLSCISGICRK